MLINNNILYIINICSQQHKEKDKFQGLLKPDNEFIAFKFKEAPSSD